MISQSTIDEIKAVSRQLSEARSEKEELDLRKQWAATLFANCPGPLFSAVSGCESAQRALASQLDFVLGSVGLKVVRDTA